jgi:hypothetical protein
MAIPQYLGAFLPAWGHHVASRTISWHVALVGIMKQTLFSRGFLHNFGWTGSASSEVPSAVHRPSPRRLKAPKHYAAPSAPRNHRPRATRTPTSNGAAFGATGATTNCAAEDKTCWGMAGVWRIVNSTYSTPDSKSKMLEKGSWGWDESYMTLWGFDRIWINLDLAGPEDTNRSTQRSMGSLCGCKDYELATRPQGVSAF